MLPYTINGTSRGEYKNVGNLSWLKIFEAGHEVPMFREYPLLLSKSLTATDDLHLQSLKFH